MSMLVATFLIVGAALMGAAIVAFWNQIANWLNNTAADKIGQVLGYDARTNMIKAVSHVTRVMDKIKNKSEVYARRSMLDTHIQKVTLTATAPAYSQDEDVLQKLEDEGELVNEFTCSYR